MRVRQIIIRINNNKELEFKKIPEKKFKVFK